MTFTPDEAFFTARAEAVRQRVDLAGWRSSFSHTCKHKGRPAGKFGRAGVGYGWPSWLKKFTEKQGATLHNVMANLAFDYNLPRGLYPDFRGFWPLWVAPDLLKDRATVQVQADEFMGLFTPRDKLETAIEELQQSSAFMSPVRQKLVERGKSEEKAWLDSGELPKGVTSPGEVGEFFRERNERRYVTQHMLHTFYEGVGECIHFQRQKCVTCGESFQPEESEQVSSMMSPIICRTCSDVMHVRLDRVPQAFGDGEQ